MRQFSYTAGPLIVRPPPHNGLSQSELKLKIEKIIVIHVLGGQICLMEVHGVQIFHLRHKNPNLMA